MTINKAFEIIEDNYEEADFIGEIKEENIIAAENKLQVTLPKSYRLFLQKYGAGDIFGEEIFGLGIEESGIPNMVWITEQLREEAQLPKQLICFYFTGYDGEYLCLDCSNIKRIKDDHAKVVSFFSGLALEEQQFEIIADTFADFLLNLLTDS
ncbi:SMI1/KNR4 family protein [Mesobacillus harenae]|uniref:SMI1/KNR4 family protein n=1 Tax=Mesobacillus harenae TaxID=2213203 RepID=UPI00157FD0A6